MVYSWAKIPRVSAVESIGDRPQTTKYRGRAAVIIGHAFHPSSSNFNDLIPVNPRLPGKVLGSSFGGEVLNSPERHHSEFKHFFPGK